MIERKTRVTCDVCGWKSKWVADEVFEGGKLADTAVALNLIRREHYTDGLYCPTVDQLVPARFGGPEPQGSGS